MNKIIKTEITFPKTMAELLLSSDIPKWKKYLIKKLIPKEFYEMPATKIANLQKGDTIGHMEIHILGTNND